jgi:hypothetical protein
MLTDSAVSFLSPYSTSHRTVSSSAIHDHAVKMHDASFDTKITARRKLRPVRFVAKPAEYRQLLVRCHLYSSKGYPKQWRLRDLMAVGTTIRRQLVQTLGGQASSVSLSVDYVH